MRNVLLSSNSILTSPTPSVSVKSLGAEAIEMELSFRVPDIAASGNAKNEIFDLIHRHAKAAGLGFAQADGDASAIADTVPPAHRSPTVRLLDAVPLFCSLTDDEKEVLAGAMTRRTFRKDEVVAQQGEVLGTLMIVRAGVLVVTRQEGQAEEELGRMAPGDCFGEAGLLTGAGEAGTIRALTFAVLVEVARDVLVQLMRDRPGIADELGTILAQHAAAGRHALPKEADTGMGGSVAWLAARIRQVLHIQ
jgi:CRP-like cAMP-binding protein